MCMNGCGTPGNLLTMTLLPFSLSFSAYASPSSRNGSTSAVPTQVNGARSLKLGADRASMNHDTSFCTSFLLATRAEFRDINLRASNHFSFDQSSKGVNSASCML